ncbi:MAG TPA: NUDIX hydrolase [Nakamurella sp.]
MLGVPFRLQVIRPALASRSEIRTSSLRTLLTWISERRVGRPGAEPPVTLTAGHAGVGPLVKPGSFVAGWPAAPSPVLNGGLASSADYVDTVADNTQHPDPVAGEAIRPAATVMLVRDGADGLETFVLRRVPAMAFAAGMTVFPGGGVDPADHDRSVGWLGPDPVWWGSALGDEPEPARALVVAAVRELFEETGVLLAGRDRSGPVAVPDDASRVAVVERRTTLVQVLAGAGLRLRTDLLRPWANWLTPPGQGRRYDTFFFAAGLPAGQQALMLTTEADLGEWRRPADLLDEWKAGGTKLMPPTIAMLRDLAGFASAGEVLGAARVVTKIRVRRADVARLVAGDGLEVPR